jgi:hypothetical protein
MAEKMDMADHLVEAAKLADRAGLTKQEFINNAETFFDSWVKVSHALRLDRTTEKEDV